MKSHVKYYGCPVLSDIANKDYTPTQYSQAVGRERRLLKIIAEKIALTKCNKAVFLIGMQAIKRGFKNE